MPDVELEREPLERFDLEPQMLHAELDVGVLPPVTLVLLVEPIELFEHPARDGVIAALEIHDSVHLQKSPQRLKRHAKTPLQMLGIAA